MRKMLVAALALLLAPVGHAAAQERIDAKIVGGQPALGAVSFIASLQTDDGDHQCGGSVIAAEWVLTAAHCVIQFGGNTDVSQVRIGSLDRTSGGEVRQAAEFHTHPEFNDAKAPLGDIALIRLSAPVSATPVALAREVPRGSRLRLLGWGVDCANPNGCGRELPRRLNQVDVTAVDAAQCAPGRGEEITEICHDNPGGADACTFDSGGPALLDGRLAGVASRDGSGPDCGDGTGIYTSVPAYQDFIDKTINQLPS